MRSCQVGGRHFDEVIAAFDSGVILPKALSYSSWWRNQRAVQSRYGHVAPGRAIGICPTDRPSPRSMAE